MRSVACRLNKIKNRYVEEENMDRGTAVDTNISTKAHWKSRFSILQMNAYETKEHAATPEQVITMRIKKGKLNHS